MDSALPAFAVTPFEIRIRGYLPTGQKLLIRLPAVLWVESVGAEPGIDAPGAMTGLTGAPPAVIADGATTLRVIG